jgi:hypothetical protein
MALGPGKYDDLATLVRANTSARGVILLVIEGDQGGGFSVQATADIIVRLPTLLRRIADDIERDL